MSTGTLSAKHKAFAHAYSATHNATAAAKDAGYAKNRAGRTGHELLQRPDVVALVEELDADKREATGIDEASVVDHLVELFTLCMAGTPRTRP
jgi:phage terminase small subunit